MVIDASPARALRASAARLEHDPEKCEADFQKDHAQSRSQSAMTIQSNLSAL
jgi:hypothetical protein